MKTPIQDIIDEYDKWVAINIQRLLFEFLSTKQKGQFDAMCEQMFSERREYPFFGLSAKESEAMKSDPVRRIMDVACERINSGALDDMPKTLAAFKTIQENAKKLQ